MPREVYAMKTPKEHQLLVTIIASRSRCQCTDGTQMPDIAKVIISIARRVSRLRMLPLLQRML